MLTADEIAPLVRSSGVFRVKARRLRAFLDFLRERFSGGVQAMAAGPAAALREALVSVHGIGRETADSIALYAAGLPLFVVDAYTRRVVARLGLLRGDEPYDEVQALSTGRLPADAALFDDFHAQLVRLARTSAARVRSARVPSRAACAEARRVVVAEAGAVRSSDATPPFFLAARVRGGPAPPRTSGSTGATAGPS